MCRGGVLRVTLVSLAGVLALAAVTGVEAQGGATLTVEVRVWQHVTDGRDIYVNARAVGGAWAGLTALTLDDGFSTTGRFRFGDASFEVPLANYEAPAQVEVRVWQDVLNDSNIHVSTRPAGGSWRLEALSLDDGFSRNRRYHYGETRLEAPLPGGGVTTLVTWAEAQVLSARQQPGSMGVAVDRDGSVVLADTASVRRIAPDGTFSLLAREGRPTDVAIAADGAVYVADRGNRRILKITPAGEVTVAAGADYLAGGPRPPVDGPADQAVFIRPSRVALGPQGDLYIADDKLIRRLSTSGMVSTFAGRGGEVALQFRWLRDIAVDDEGYVYALDGSDYWTGGDEPDYTVYRIAPNGFVETLFQSDPATAEGLLVSPGGIAVSAGGEVFLSNSMRNQIVKIAGRDRLVAVAGTGADGYRDGALDQALFSWPGRIAVSPSGALVVIDQTERAIRAVFPDAELGFAGVALAPLPEPLPVLEGVSVRTFAGLAGAGDLLDGPAGEALFREPAGLALDAAGGVLVADVGNEAVRRIAPDGQVTTLAGGNGRGSEDGPGDVARFSRPRDVAVGPDGTVFVADEGNRLLRAIAPDGVVGPAFGSLFEAGALASDADGNLLLVETAASRVLRIESIGEYQIVVDGAAEGLRPGQFLSEVAVDGRGAVYYAIVGGRYPTSVRRVDPDGTVTTVLEDRPGRYGGLLSTAVPRLAVAPDGTVYLSDENHRRILRVTPAGEVAVVTTWRGRQAPSGILITPEGTLLVSDRGLHAIHEITFEDEDGE